MFGLMSDLVICELKEYDAECPYWDQASLNNIKFILMNLTSIIIFQSEEEREYIMEDKFDESDLEDMEVRIKLMIPNINSR